MCYDTETNDEVAVEVKEITREYVEAKSEAIYNLLHEVRENLQNNLPGSFSLFVAIDSDYDFPFKKTSSYSRRLCLRLLWLQRIDLM